MEKSYQPFGIGVGTVIGGRYELMERLGSGANSAVYKVYDRTLSNDTIALKLFSPAALVDETAIERIYNEALFSRKLTHPNIVRTYDIGRSTDGHLFLTMEHVAGSSLDKLIHGPELLRPYFSESVRILRDVTRGLGFAHSQGIIHRDVKPANILVGTNGEVKVTDFGLARAISRGHDLTQAGECVGTPYYMAPEQVQDRPVDCRTDVYALGIIAFELVTGRVPFHEPGWYDLAQRILHERTPDLGRLVKIPAWYSELVQRATAKAADSRYSSFEEVESLLQEKLDAGIEDEEGANAALLPKVLSMAGLRRASTQGRTAVAIQRLPRPTVSNTKLLILGSTLGALILGGSLLSGKASEMQEGMNSGAQFVQAAGNFMQQMREGAQYAQTHKEDLQVLVKSLAEAAQEAQDAVNESDGDASGAGKKPSRAQLLRQFKDIERQILNDSAGSPAAKQKDAEFRKYVDGLGSLIDQNASGKASSESQRSLREQLQQLTELQHQLEAKIDDQQPPGRETTDRESVGAKEAPADMQRKRRTR